MENNTKSPLSAILGIWKGDSGVDLAPKPTVDENNPYYETLTIETVDIDIENAGEQELKAVRYHQIITEKATGDISHSEVGYWIWDEKEQIIMNSFSIPRGVCVLAGGKVIAKNNNLILKVSAKIDNPKWGIIQSPFMLKKAKTLSFNRTFEISNNTLTYIQETQVDIYGKLFNHKDSNTLTKQ